MTNRPLTEKEKEICPEGFDRYYVNVNQTVLFINSITGEGISTCWLNRRQLRKVTIPYIDETLIKLTGSTGKTAEPKITGVDFSKSKDETVIDSFDITNANLFCIPPREETRQDVINKAKALGITWEELNA